MSNQGKPASATTGVAGMDDILRGGFPAGRLLLIEGDPGVGKTTLALQFLLEGARRGERGLYITLSETARGAARRSPRPTAGRSTASSCSS